MVGSVDQTHPPTVREPGTVLPSREKAGKRDNATETAFANSCRPQQPTYFANTPRQNKCPGSMSTKHDRDSTTHVAEQILESCCAPGNIGKTVRGARPPSECDGSPSQPLIDQTALLQKEMSIFLAVSRNTGLCETIPNSDFVRRGRTKKCAGTSPMVPTGSSARSKSDRTTITKVSHNS